jgi:hypothetical protein
MYLKCHRRLKDGKEHRYWSIAEKYRVSGDRTVDRHVLYLGEINDSQREAWIKSIEAFGDRLDTQLRHLRAVRQRRAGWDGAQLRPGCLGSSHRSLRRARVE